MLSGFLEETGIPNKDMRGQGYDRASNMSSGRVGVEPRIREKAPLVTYVHCSGHSLNLVMSKSCSMPDMRNLLDRLQHCCRFFLGPKRCGLLNLINRINTMLDIEKRRPL